MKYLPNLLIVDDLKENLIFLEVIIRKVNVNLIQALSGFDALERTRGIELALAIIDVHMPEMNGYELAVKMNEERTGDKVPVIFLTAANSNEMEIYMGYDSGAVDYLSKPINAQILLSKINVFINLFNQKQIIIGDAALLKESADELARVNSALKKSEEKYRSYIESAPDGVFVADKTGRYIEVNEAASRMTGYSRNELLKMSITDIISEESLKEGLAEFSKLASTGTSKSDLLFRHKNGSKRWWALEAVKLSEKRFLGFTQEITHRKELEESLRSYQIELEMQNEELTESKEKAEVATKKYSELYDFAPTGYFTLSEEIEIQELNFSAAHILGKDRSLLTGSHFSSFVSRSSIPVFNAFIDRVFKSKVKEICEVTLKRDGNELKYIHLEGMVTANCKQCLMNAIDITELKRAEQMLQNNLNMLNETGEIAKVGGWEVDINTGTQTWTNETFRIFEIDLTNYEPLVTGSMNFYVPASRPIIELAMERAIKYGESFDLELEIITAKGNRRWVRSAGKRNPGNRETRSISGAIQDISERKMAELAIRISEEKYRTMLNASPDGIVLIDLNLIITEVSEIALELFGAYKRDELVGENLLLFVPDNETNSLKEIFERTINEGLVQNIGLKIRKKNRSMFAAEISVTLIQDPQGIPLSYMIIIRDITHRKKMETQQLHVDRMSNLGEMATGIAHEINQPLNIISMVMDKILFEIAKTETINIEFLKNKSDKIFENITRIRNIIDHVRAFSRSHDEYVLTAFDINTSIENASSLLAEQFKHLGISLNLRLEREIPQIVGNTLKFEQVIVNLLINAKDAVIERKNKQEEYTDMIVLIRTCRENNFLVVEVKDNGIGISNSDIHNVMLPFYTTKDEGTGTGIGLSICYQIIKEMNGTIDITSDGINGTNIKLILDSQMKK